MFLIKINNPIKERLLKMKKMIFMIPVILSFLFITNAYSQWYQQNSGTTQTLRGFHFFDSNTGIVYGINGVILRTTNAGQSWILHPIGINEWFTSINFINENTGYITGHKYLLKTTNRGVNWETTFFSNADGFTSIAFFDDNTGYLFGYHCDYSFRTTNGGSNWNQLCTSFPQNGGASIYYCSQKINDTLILVGGAVTTTHTSPGASFFWAKRDSITPGYPWSDGSFVSAIIMAGNSGIGYAFRTGEILKTTNYGFQWSITPLIWGSMNFYNENLGLYFRGQGNHYLIYYSTDRGTQWILRDSILFYNYNTINSLKYITQDIAVAVGDSGKILRNNNYSIGIKLISKIIPNNYSMSQNNPNPFNPTTKIKFDLPKSTQAKLIIYDILGREVTTLVNEKLNAGSYEVEWSAGSYPSGIYFYRITTKDFSQTKRMILIK
ncbi:YCF48-related protein [Bacteroidota bacterium]